MVVGIDAMTMWARTLPVDEDLNLDLITNGGKKAEPTSGCASADEGGDRESLRLSGCHLSSRVQ